MGSKLAEAFVDAGLPRPHVNLKAPMGSDRIGSGMSI
jgi:hypothetical protein